MENLKQLSKEFLTFIEKEIEPAVLELERINTEQSRKHLQKLVYTNVVNRFDVLVDNMLLTCAADDTTKFHDVVLGKLEGVTVSLKDFYQTMLSESPADSAAEALRETVRANHLRERHSKKLRYLLEECISLDRSELNKPRVNANDGRIHVTYTPRKGTTVPPSIIGYADYLYSRRNALVHGSKTNYLKKHDSAYIKKNFKIDAPKTVGVKLASIKSASTFYKYLCNYIINEKWPEGRGF
tara:strand:+ start:965 stop:1684 length:720 start_codon:yes stop_codon:yes gene_type:complete